MCTNKVYFLYSNVNVLLFLLMLYFAKKILHFLTSNSRHGTHSPFVYSLAEQVIYSRKNKRNKESLQAAIVRYFEKQGYTQEQFCTLSLIDYTVEELVALQEKYFMLFVELPHRHASEPLWQQLQRDSRFVVLIDLFELGIICKRKEQRKEYFKLRYPYWLY